MWRPLALSAAPSSVTSFARSMAATGRLVRAGAAPASACYVARMLTDRAGLPAEELAQLTTRITGHPTLGHVVRDWATSTPPRAVLDVVTQDEYTHDIILVYRDEIHLVYDTT